MKTLSAYMKGPWQFELRQVELPETPPAGFVQLKVQACGVCGTDLSAACRMTDKFKPFGHEIAAVVERLGPEVAGLKEGQSVVLESSSFCGRCELCRNGRVDLCAKAPNFWSQPAMGFSQRMLAPATCLVQYEGLEPAVASLTEPAGVAYDMVRVAEVRLGDRVCVMGPGPIGLMAVALARYSGATRLACIGHSHSRARLKLAETLGADAIACDEPIDQRKALAKQFDHVLLTSPTDTIPAALSLLAYEGKLTYVGIGHGGGSITFDANDFHFRKLQLRASFAAPAVFFPRVVELLKAGIIPGRRLISDEFALADIGVAMLKGRDDKARVLKLVMVNP